MSASVSLVTNGHFSTSPRLWKEADALAAAGFDVEVFGVRCDPRQAAWDDALAPRHAWRFTPAFDLTAASAWRRFAARGRRRVAVELARRGWATPGAFGYALPKLVAAAQRRRADLTIGHLEYGLLAARALADSGLRVGVDMEDWHSHNAAAAGYRPAEVRLLERAERAALSVACHRTTTSAALAHALAKEHGIPEPVVVRNALAAGHDPGPPPDGPLRLFWLSQTIGAGRGLELLFEALRELDGPWELALLGRCSDDTRRWAEGALGPRADRLRIVPPTTPDALPAEVSRHDVGLALETDRCVNALLTTSNKMFHYLQAGLATVASDTPGQREVAALLPEHVALFPLGDAAALRRLLAERRAELPRLRETRPARAAAADRELAYERSAATLVASVRAALAEAPRR